MTLGSTGGALSRTRGHRDAGVRVKGSFFPQHVPITARVRRKAGEDGKGWGRSRREGHILGSCRWRLLW